MEIALIGGVHFVDTSVNKAEEKLLPLLCRVSKCCALCTEIVLLEAYQEFLDALI